MNKCPSSVPGCEGVPESGTPIRDRGALLRNLAVGDIFHASAPNGASLICLATAVTDAIVQARAVTHQTHLAFDRETGIAELNGAQKWPRHTDEVVQCITDSVAPLPIDVHEVILFVDRKSRLTYLSGEARLSDDEKQAFLFLYSHYREHPLPGANMHDPAVEAGLIERCLAPYLIPAQAIAPSPGRLS